MVRPRDDFIFHDIVKKMGKITYYRDVKTTIDLQDFTREDFNNRDKFKNESPMIIDGRKLVQIGGVPLSQGYMWCTFSSGNEFFCYSINKCDDESTLISNGDTFEEMYDHFIITISKLWKLH